MPLGLNEKKAPENLIKVDINLATFSFTINKAQGLAAWFIAQTWVIVFSSKP